MPSESAQVLIEVVRRMASLDFQVTQDAITMSALYRSFIKSDPENVSLFEREREVAKTLLDNRKASLPLHAYEDIIQRLNEL